MPKLAQFQLPPKSQYLKRACARVRRGHANLSDKSTICNKYQGRSALASQHPPERGVEPFQLHFPLHDLPCSFAFAASSGALPKAIAAAE